MITAVDTNVLIDVLQADPTHGPDSRRALQRCLDEGKLVASAVVWAETVATFPEAPAVVDALGRLGVGFNADDLATATAAGVCWRAYRRAGGPRSRVVADFLVGAHAATRADRLLTRDRGFFRHYFADLTVLDPTVSA